MDGASETKMKKNLKRKEEGFTPTPIFDNFSRRFRNGKHIDNQKIKNQSQLVWGFTIIELLVTLFIFSLLVTGFVGVFSAMARTAKLARQKTVLSSLASQYLEGIRNLPYSQVGTVHGVPGGSLPDCPVSQQPSCPNAYTQTVENVPYKIYYEATWIDDPADGLATGTVPVDLNPTDYKQVKMDILNTLTGEITNFVTTVTPKGLEGASNTGVLWIKIFDSNGQPVSGASISLTGVSNGVILSLLSDNTGQWEQVGLPPGTNAYHVVVTKSGYSTDQTYPITGQNPNPTKPDPTILAEKVTQVSFQIDLLSNLTIKTLDNQCHNLNGIGVSVQGSKLIGTSPNVYKFNQTKTSGPAAYPAGQIVFNNIEWDTYTPTLTSATLQNWNVMGTSPIQKITVLPNTSQTFTILLVPPSDNSLLVVVKDASTLAPLEGATVELKKGGSQPQDYFGSTGGSVWVQNDWSGNSGVAMWATATEDSYWQAGGGIYVNNGSNDVELLAVNGKYTVNSTSTLESSTFDTGTGVTNFTTLSWLPASQDPAATLAIQLAANSDNATWNYVGPDGTANTYYTVPGSNISNSLDNNQYVRYKAYLSTRDNKKTPVLSSIQINYVSGCQTPGQWLFDDITPSNGNAYTLTVSLSGYQTKIVSGVQVGGNGTISVLLSH
jgi:type II secretory pathway pseudopilin PulG